MPANYNRIAENKRLKEFKWPSQIQDFNPMAFWEHQRAVTKQMPVDRNEIKQH